MIGRTLGSYEVVAKLGEGGMGEVYRARDTKLNRDIAIKILPDVFAHDVDRVARFTREAQTLAALNHPHIAQIYGVLEEPAAGGAHVHALVMELVEGEDLSAHIARGPIALADALPIAKQIAEALEAAHEQGIVHRDLKPANIKVREDGTVKVLDFGLAKALDTAGAAGAEAMNSPTLTARATQMGMIIGTAAYMAPEQARGKAVDRRADIWAFGVVLYEMLTGRRAFEGEDVSITLASVLKEEVQWLALPEDLPAPLAKLLRRCLEKDPRRRLSWIGEARLTLEDPAALQPAVAAASVAAAPAGPIAPRWRRMLPWALAAVLGIALGVALWAPWRSAGPADRPLVRANLDLPGYIGGDGDLALSPDGTRIAYVARGQDGKNRLVTRLLAEGEAKTLAGTEGAGRPFFSPDGQWIGFGADGQVKKVLALGGAPLKVTDAPAFGGGSWADDGFIVATVDVSGEMRRIPETGGAGETLRLPWAGGGPSPQVLPGGSMVIFSGRDAQGPAVRMLSLETKEVSTLIPGASAAQYVPTNGAIRGASGHLLYRNGNTLLAAPFDPAAGELRGPAIPVLDDVAGTVGVSSAGDVLYPIGVASGGSGWPLRWLRPDGTTESLLETEGRYTFPRVSPDGNLLAVTVDEDRAAESRLVVYDWRNDRTLTLAEKGQVTGAAVWTPDSRHVIWATPTTNGKRQFLWRRADGSGDTYTLVESSTSLNPTAISPDGKYLALHVWGGAETKIDSSVATLDLSTPDEMTLGHAEALVRLPGTEGWPVFSPDGRWVAYFSDESGTYEVYVQRFPGGGGHRKVSEGGGIYPKWSSNGRQLLYAAPGPNHIMAVDYQGNGDAFVASKPRPWSATPIRVAVSDHWGLDPKGERAVMAPAEVAAESAGPPKVAYLLHFFDELRRKAPVRK